MTKYIPVPEAPYDPDEHVAAVWKMLHALNSIRDSIDDHIEQRIKDDDDDLSDEFTQHVYSEAAYSHTAAAALAALFEGAFRHEFGLMETWDSQKPIDRKKGARRSSLPARSFWNPVKHTDSKGKVRRSPNIVVGTLQIMEAIELLDAMPQQFPLVIEMLFLYRNNTMHNGYEWGLKRRTNFNDNIAKAGASHWFDVSLISGEPWTFTMTDQFIQLCFDIANDTIKVLKKRNRDYQWRDKPKSTIPKVTGFSPQISEAMETAMINAFYDPRFYKPLRDRCPRPVEP